MQIAVVVGEAWNSAVEGKGLPCGLKSLLIPFDLLAGNVAIQSSKVGTASTVSCFSRLAGDQGNKQHYF